MQDKKQARLRRARKTRAKIAELKVNRLVVMRTNSHIYASVISAEGNNVLATASTVQAALRANGNGSTVEAAKAVGTAIAEKAKAAGVTQVAFDRSGFQFHGRVKALAEAAREAGLQF
ncbi:MAG: 50S ribosomal protein L18 [Burkholderiales bacterium]|nr:50S ribosomal protein L18 [Burkholderiales bacterium]